MKVSNLESQKNLNASKKLIYDFQVFLWKLLIKQIIFDNLSLIKSI